MNAKNQLPSMYETNQAIAGLNKVPGFDPRICLRRAKSKTGNQEVLKLDLRYKKLWFRLAHPTGRLKTTALRITEQLAIIEAKVFLDRNDTEPVANFTVQRTIHDTPGGLYIQAAQYEAQDVALNDAGFGLQFSDVSVVPGEELYGSEIPLTSLVSTSASASANTTIQPKHIPTQTVADTTKPMTTITADPIAAASTVTEPDAAKQAPTEPPISVSEKTEVSTADATAEAVNKEIQTNIPEESYHELPVSEPSTAENLIVTETTIDHIAATAAETISSEEIQQDSETVSSEESLLITETDSNVEAQQATAMTATGETQQPMETAPADGTPQTAEATSVTETLKPTETAMADETLKPTETDFPDHTDTGNPPIDFSSHIAQESYSEAPRYTRATPVEELLTLMTYEDACNVYVDIGTCNGLTMKTVAERRPPSLKWYIHGYNGDNNILRAAAQIMLDSLSVQKAG